MLRKIKQLLGSKTHTFLVYGPDTRCNVVITAEFVNELLMTLGLHFLSRPTKT